MGRLLGFLVCVILMIKMWALFLTSWPLFVCTIYASSQRISTGDRWAEMVSLRNSFYEPMDTVDDVDNALKCFCLCNKITSCVAVGFVLSSRNCQLYSQLDKGAVLSSSRIWMRYTAPGVCRTPGYYYHHHLGFCIKFHYEVQPGYLARDTCLKEGGRLLVADTAAKHEALQNTEYKDFYIGGYRSHNNWYWLDGSGVHMSRIYWHPGEPSHGPEYCLWYMYFNSKLLLDDQRCSTCQRFICEEFH